MNDIWAGKWFKLNIKNSGYGTDSGIVSPYCIKKIKYLRIDNIDEQTRSINFTLFDYEGGYLVEADKGIVYYLGTNPLDFLIYYFGCDEEETECMGFDARIKGTMKNGVLTGATFKGIGGMELRKDTTPESVGKISISGRLVPESKLPPIQPL